jgi:hypothetical protein
VLKRNVGDLAIRDSYLFITSNRQNWHAWELRRTPLVANRLDGVADRMFKQVANVYPGVTSEDLEAVRFGSDKPALVTFSQAAAIIYAVIDLKLHLLCAGPDQSFVASLSRSHKSAALLHCALDYNNASSLMVLWICWANQRHTFFSPTPGSRLWASL